MTDVTAISSFDHNGARRRGDEFSVSPGHARALKAAGLVRINGPDDPDQAAGEKSSASPAAPASRKQTASKSGAGGSKAKAAPSS